MGIVFVFTKHKSEPHLVGFSDADWGGCLESRKPTSGYVLWYLCVFNTTEPLSRIPASRITRGLEYVSIP